MNVTIYKRQEFQFNGMIHSAKCRTKGWCDNDACGRKQVIFEKFRMKKIKGRIYPKRISLFKCMICKRRHKKIGPNKFKLTNKRKRLTKVEIQ